MKTDMLSLPRWIDAGWLIVFGLIGIVTSLVVLFERAEPIIVPLSLAGYIVGNRLLARIYTGRWDGESHDLGDEWRDDG